MTNNPPSLIELVAAARAGIDRIVTYGGEEDVAVCVIDKLDLDEEREILNVHRDVLVRTPITFICLTLEI